MRGSGKNRSAPSRRDVLAFGASAAAMAASPRFAFAEEDGRTWSFFAEGPVPLVPSFVVSPAPPPLPPDLVAAIAAGQLEIRARFHFQAQPSILTITIFVTPPSYVTPLPLPPPPPDESLVSVIRIRVQHVVVSAHPSLNFGLVGRVVRNVPVSPFGDLTGRAAALGSGVTLNHTGRAGRPRLDADFTLLGGTVAGSHATFAPLATGWVSVTSDRD